MNIAKATVGHNGTYVLTHNGNVFRNDGNTFDPDTATQVNLDLDRTADLDALAALGIDIHRYTADVTYTIDGTLEVNYADHDNLTGLDGNYDTTITQRGAVHVRAASETHARNILEASANIDDIHTITPAD